MIKETIQCKQKDKNPASIDTKGTPVKKPKVTDAMDIVARLKLRNQK